ncbi:MAG: TerB family tellurite resistance protein [Bacteroidales bacterium]|jgi:uncharacterized tellurite resistance protein B-like protein|nr:TerB family tellurite resistance protein [Bacteroidales bacterium]
MTYLNLSYEDLASVLCLAIHLADADGNIDDTESAAIIKALTDQYNFEGKDDLLKEYLDSAFKMEPAEALIHVAAFDANAKQWTSNFLVKTIVADNVLTDREKELYWKIQELCKLPDNNL